MSKIKNKLCNVKGETLIESVAAILIFTFASIILLSMISTAAKINYTAKQEDKLIWEELDYAEAQETKTESKTVRIEYGGKTDTVTVDIYSSAKGILYSFSSVTPAEEDE